MRAGTYLHGLVAIQRIKEYKLYFTNLGTSDLFI